MTNDFSLCPGKCTLPKATGKCEGFAQLSVTRWYYNTEAGQCEQFVYSLCGGNENRFKSKGACEEECVRPAAVVEEPEPEEKADSSGDDDDFGKEALLLVIIIVIIIVIIFICKVPNIWNILPLRGG